MIFIKKIKKLLSKKKEYYFSRYYYRQLLDKYTVNINIYIKLLNVTNTFEKKIITTNSISSYSKISFKSSINHTKKVYGQPTYTIINESIDDVVILFYRLKFAEQKVKCEFHFYNNELFYIKYIFSYLSQKHKDTIIDIIEKKYLEGNKFDYLNSLIKDKQDNHLFISEDSHFNLDYLAIDSSFYHNIAKLREINEQKRLENEQYFIKQLKKRL